jgi:hypothetical protein
VHSRSRRNRRRIGSSSPVVGIIREIRGEDPDSPYLKMRSSSITVVLETRAASDDSASRLAGRALIRKHTLTTAQ